MLPCSAPYTAQLKSCNIRADKGDEATAWISSVYNDSRMMTSDEDGDLQAAYWTDNLIGRVLFSQAIEHALDDGRGAPDLILEVGPHAALKGPTLETMRHKLGYDVPYAGVLDRKLDDITALNRALGLVWTHLGSACVDFRAYASAFGERNSRIDASPLPDLPSYPWDHRQPLFRESRLNRQIRLRSDRPHALLGNRTPDDTDYEPRWRNFFKLDEMPWLREHSIQGQIIVPAATYCVMALEAARVLGRGKQIQSIELSNLALLRPIILDESSEGTETLLSLRSDLDSSKDKNDSIWAEFNLSSAAMEDGHMRIAATGELRMLLASDEEVGPTMLFPSRSLKPQSELLPVNSKQFYDSLSKVGLSYNGPFRAMSSVKRRMDMATAVVTIDQIVANSLPVHPTWLDACFQTFFAAFAAPRDGSLWTAFMPTTIGRMTFSPSSISGLDIPNSVNVDTRITEFTPGFKAALPTIKGDMKVYNSKSSQLAVQVDDFTMSSFVPATARDDKLLYLRTVWQPDILSRFTVGSAHQDVSSFEQKAIDACERAIHYYLSKLSAYEPFLETAKNFPGLSDILGKIAPLGSDKAIPCDMSPILEKFGNLVDMAIIRTVGENLLNSSQRPSQNPTEASNSLSDLVSRWHDDGLGMAEIQRHMVSAARQISHQHSRLRILQVGPSSARLIRSIFRELGHSIASYTLMDRSSEAIEEIEAHLIHDKMRVDYKVIDVEDGLRNLNDVDIATAYFDLIIVHKAFRKQTAAMKAVRSFLRPGGFLLIMAATGSTLRFPFFLLSAPPLLEEDGPVRRKFTNATREETHSLLQSTGFSGVDHIVFDNIQEKHTFSVIVSQALDDRISFLRSPLASTKPLSAGGKLVVLGGCSLKVANFIRLVQTKLSRVWSGQIVTVDSLADLKGQESHMIDYVLSLTELDGPMIESLSASTFNNLQRLLNVSKTILWITQGARCQDPYQSGTIGLGRTFQSENPQKLLQFLDMDTLEGGESLVAETLLRLIEGTTMRDNDLKTSYLWNIEPKIAVEEGAFLVPRVLPDMQRNHRLNAIKRHVETQAPVGEKPIALVRSSDHADGVMATYTAVKVLQHQSDLAELSMSSEQISLRVEYCSRDPVIPNYHGKELFCCIGRTQNGLRFLALSISNSSVVSVPRMWTVRLEDEALQDTMIIPLFVRVLKGVKSQLIKKSMPAGYTTLLYGIDTHLAACLDQQEYAIMEDFTFIDHQTHSTFGSPRKHIKVRPLMSRDELKSMIPPKTRLLIHMRHSSDARTILDIQRVLPMSAACVSFDALNADGVAPTELLLRALNFAKSLSTSPPTTLDNINFIQASKLVRQGAHRHVNDAIVDWRGDQIITLTERPMDAGYLFSADKTYLLVGLSGQIGQSMCRWMVNNGARHIVVTRRYVLHTKVTARTCLTLVYRNPEKQPLWKEELRQQGASVVIEAVDVTKKQSLLDLRTRILSTMPPIGGVANGAMVLSDKLFADMTYHSFHEVLKPKVDGSRNLDEIFSGDSLDFFILFSSISAVTGQRSQANYAAANNVRRMSIRVYLASE